MRRIAVAVMLAAVPLSPLLAQPSAPTETVKVQAAPIPDAAVSGFVHTFTEPSLLSGKIPRWFSGICVRTQGLPRELADAVTKRIVDVATMVGAPVQEQPCTLNTVVIFDADPQGVMDDIASKHGELLGPHDPAQTEALKKVRFPVQAWYATETQDNNGTTVTDTTADQTNCGTTDENVFNGSPTGALTGGIKVNTTAYSNVVNNMRRDCGKRVVKGSRLRDGVRSQLAAVTVVAALDTVRYHELAAVADYLALVILSQTKAFETCEKMETVANLLVPRCDLDGRVKGLMPGDLAFLKALYRADTDGTLVMQQASITNEMKKLLNGP